MNKIETAEDLVLLNKIETAEDLNYAVNMLSYGETETGYGSKRRRTTYIKNDLDIRRAPKNGSSSIVRVYAEYLKSQGLPGFGDNLNHLTHHLKPRPELLDRTPGLEDYQFRVGSYRVTIKRDPIERALSAAKYLYKSLGENDDPDPKEVDKFLNICDLNANHHFWSQTYYLMDRNVYDRIVDITELDDYIIELCEKLRYDYDPVKFNDNSTSRKITVADLSTSTYNKLKDYYKIDYDNGWY